MIDDDGIVVRITQLLTQIAEAIAVGLNSLMRRLTTLLVLLLQVFLIIREFKMRRHQLLRRAPCQFVIDDMGSNPLLCIEVTAEEQHQYTEPIILRHAKGPQLNFHTTHKHFKDGVGGPFWKCLHHCGEITDG